MKNVNTYGSVHNDPLTSFLGLFGKNGQTEGRKIIKPVFIPDLFKTGSVKMFIQVMMGKPGDCWKKSRMAV